MSELGKIKSATAVTNCMEMVIEIDGCLYVVIYGLRESGNWFFAIPNWSKGGNLADPSDTFWNTESLNRELENEDAAAAIAKNIKIMNEMMQNVDGKGDLSE